MVSISEHTLLAYSRTLLPKIEQLLRLKAHLLFLVNFQNELHEKSQNVPFCCVELWVLMVGVQKLNFTPVCKATLVRLTRQCDYHLFIRTNSVTSHVPAGQVAIPRIQSTWRRAMKRVPSSQMPSPSSCVHSIHLLTTWCGHPSSTASWTCRSKSVCEYTKSTSPTTRNPSLAQFGCPAKKSLAVQQKRRQLNGNRATENWSLSSPASVL